MLTGCDPRAPWRMSHINRHIVLSADRRKTEAMFIGQTAAVLHHAETAKSDEEDVTSWRPLMTYDWRWLYVVYVQHMAHEAIPFMHAGYLSTITSCNRLETRAHTSQGNTGTYSQALSCMGCIWRTNQSLNQANCWLCTHAKAVQVLPTCA